MERECFTHKIRELMKDMKRGCEDISEELPCTHKGQKKNNEV